MTLVVFVASGLPLAASDLPNVGPVSLIQNLYRVDAVPQPFLIVECGEPKRCETGNERARDKEFQVGSLVVAPAVTALDQRSGAPLEYCNPLRAWNSLGQISGGQVGTPVFELTKPLLIKTLGDFLGSDLAVLKKADFDSATLRFVDGRSNQIHPPEPEFLDQAVRFCRTSFPRYTIGNVVIRTVTARIEINLASLKATNDIRQFLTNLGFRLEVDGANRPKLTSGRFYVIGYSTLRSSR